MNKNLVLALLAALAGCVVGGAGVWLLLDRPMSGPTAAADSAPAREQSRRSASAATPDPGQRTAAPASPSPRGVREHAGTRDPSVDHDGTSAPRAASPTVQNIASQQPVIAPEIPSPEMPPEPKAPSPIVEALSYAIEAGEPFLKEGFTMREDYWSGELPVKQSKAIAHQLFKGNENWFWAGTPTDGAKISVHIYDANGTLAEAESWQKAHQAAARVVPKKTGMYYLIFEVEKSPLERTPWAMTYGFR